MGRVDESITPHPQLIAGLWQVRYDVPSLSVGNYDPGKPCVQIAGLGDNPNTGLRSVPANDDTANVVVVDWNGRWWRLASGGQCHRHSKRERGQPDRQLYVNLRRSRRTAEATALQDSHTVGFSSPREPVAARRPGVAAHPTR